MRFSPRHERAGNDADLVSLIVLQRVATASAAPEEDLI
jgi:hypothetical protein